MQKAGTFFGLIQPWRLAYSQATRKDALHWWPPRGTVLKTTFTVVNKYSWSHSLKGQKILQKHGYVVHAYIHRVLRVSYLWLAALWGWQICEIWLHLEGANEHTPGRESVHLTEKKNHLVPVRLILKNSIVIMIEYIYDFLFAAQYSLTHPGVYERSLKPLKTEVRPCLFHFRTSLFCLSPFFLWALKRFSLKCWRGFFRPQVRERFSMCGFAGLPFIFHLFCWILGFFSLLFFL